jgi:phosphonate transport system permease protein
MMNIDVFKRKKRNHTIFGILIISIMYFSATITDFDFFHGIETLPKAFSWMLANLFFTQETLTKLPSVMEKLIETFFLSLTATTTASIFALFFGLMGSKTTMINRYLAAISRFIASVNRNIPVVAWSLILLLSFGQNAVTGYFALFFTTFGFLTRAFIETIDEASESSVEALKATGATYFQIVAKAVIPESFPQMISWILFMIETNIRSSTLVGILTGTGIGYLFDLYYKSMNYQVVTLVTLAIVITVILIEWTSNYVRRVIL